MYRHTLRIALIVLLGLSPLAGCRSTTGQSLGRNIDDASITAQVKTRLAAAEGKTLTRIDVDTENGVVYLNGVVDDPALKTQAEQIARSEEGVRSVVNNLQVNRTR